VGGFVKYRSHPAASRFTDCAIAVQCQDQDEHTLRAFSNLRITAVECRLGKCFSMVEKMQNVSFLRSQTPRFHSAGRWHEPHDSRETRSCIIDLSV
jgi:hypothetical protein